jgi:hypothetical protein
MKLKDLILIGLVCVNVVLAALAVGFYAGKVEPTAYATSESRAGDYIMVTGPIARDRDALLVIDVVAQRANLYIPKAAVGPSTAGRWDKADSRSLKDDFGLK